MAGLPYKCKCGQKYWIDLPKKLMFEEAGFGSEVVKIGGQIDDQERRAGEIEVVKEFAERIGAKFVDARVNRVIHCECGKDFDTLAFVHEKE